MDLIRLKSCGDDVHISSGAVIKRPHLVSVGNRVAIDSGFYCTTGMEIGNYVHISPNSTCIGGVRGMFTARGLNNIMCGARIICASDRFDDSGLFGALIPDEYKGTQICSPVLMEEMSNLGTNAVMMPGSILRKGALLTIGSVLFGDTVEWGVYKGNPAKLIKIVDGSRATEFAIKMGYSF